MQLVDEDVGVTFNIDTVLRDKAYVGSIANAVVKCAIDTHMSLGGAQPSKLDAENLLEDIHGVLSSGMILSTPASRRAAGASHDKVVLTSSRHYALYMVQSESSIRQLSNSVGSKKFCRGPETVSLHDEDIVASFEYDFEGRGLRTATKTASTESGVEQSKGEEKAEAEV